MPSGSPLKQAPRKFEATRWSLVIQTRSADEKVARRALSDLCAIYWYPIYAYARGWGKSHEDAEDLIQGFFQTVLRREAFEKARADRGTLRSFLLVSFKRYCHQEHDKATALKRGGGAEAFSFDADQAEEDWAAEPAGEENPESLFDRRWARALLESVLETLRCEHEARGKGEYFEILRLHLNPSDRDESYSSSARALGISTSGAKVAVHRLRKRYRELLIEKVRDTVEDEDMVEEELRSLFAALS